MNLSNTTEKYNTIGEGYNKTRQADPFLVSRLVDLLHLNKGSKILDIGCGTGNYTSAIHQQGYKMIGIDPSALMLEKAQSNNEQITWIKATAEETGLDKKVDGMIATFTVHHWMDLDLAITELSRIIKDDGPFVILTATPFQMQGYWLNHYFPKMMEDSCSQMPSLERLSYVLSHNSFSIQKTESYNVKEDLTDFFLYSGKHHPERYLDDQFRKGISSFSAIANKEEVNNGILNLEQDLLSGANQNIIRSYENNEGDYLFIKVKKEKSCSD